MILVVCPNPAIDRTVVVERLTSDVVSRGRLAVAAAGGKGFNVARAAHTLGSAVTVVAPVGGRTGEMVRVLAAQEGLVAHFVEIEGVTRVCRIFTDGRGADKVVNETGPTLGPDEWDALCGAVASLAPEATVAAVCGSLPAVERSEPMTALSNALGDVGWWLDSSGRGLVKGIAANPVGVKVNRHELGDLTVPASISLIVTDGHRPVTARVGGSVFTAYPPQHEAIVSAVGAGDAFMAGWLTALVAGTRHALAMAVAAGTNAARHLGSGVVERSEVEALVSRIEVE